MTTNCREQQLPIDTVEVSFNIDIEHPVISPAALTGLAHRIDRRLAGSVAVGVGMKHWLQYRLQVTTDDLLSAAVGDSWNTQRPRPAPCFRNIDPPHRRRKVAPRGHAIPEFVEVARKVGLKRRNRLSVHPSRSLIRLHTFEGFPDFPFGDLERLCLVHGLLPSPDGFSWPMALAEQRSPLAPAPLQSLRHYYGLLRPCAEPSSLLRAAPSLRSASVLSPSRLEPLVACPLASENRFSRSVRKPGRASRRLHAGCHSGRLRHLPS